MFELLSPMAAILASWLLLLLVFSGLGAAILHFLGQSLCSGSALFDSIWLGWVLTLGIAQLWHLVLPVNDALFVLLAAFAFGVLYSKRNDLWSILRQAPLDKTFIALVTLMALWLSNRALGAPAAFDTGFRDMQAVMWIDAYPIVPGLANLFSSLGLNQSVYLYDALLDAFIWSGRSHHIATGFLILLYLIYSAKAALKLLRCGSGACLRWSWIFGTLTMPYILFQTAAWGGISNFLTDTAVSLVGFVCIIYLLDFVQDWRTGSNGNDYLVFRLAIIVLAGFTVKQSYVIFGAGIAVFASLVWLRRYRFRPPRHRVTGTALPLAIAACALMIPWMARGAVTSGYIAYPQTLGRLDVDWAIPVAQLRERQLNMSVNTRLRGGDRAAVLANWDWLDPWLRSFAGNIMPTMMPTMIAIVGLGLHFLGRSRPRSQKCEERLSVWISAPLLVTLLIWFLTYPEPKYVQYVFWSLAAIAVILALQSWQTVPLVRLKAIVFAIVAACLSYVLYLIIQLGAYPQPAGPERGFYPVPSVAYNQVVTDSGLTLNVPTQDLPQCWRVPLPCTPYPHPKLETRVPGDLRHGFRVAE